MPRGPARSTTESVEALEHAEALRKNIPTAELQSFAEAEEAITGFEPSPDKRALPLAAGETRPRDTDLDPRLFGTGPYPPTPEQVRVLVETGEAAIGDARDFATYLIAHIWTDVAGSPTKIYVVQTGFTVVERCILVATNP